MKFEDLLERLGELRKRNPLNPPLTGGRKLKVVLVTGVFDLLHEEHVEFLRRAWDVGDLLVVGVESDVRVKRMKGNDRPIWNEDKRVQEILKLELSQWVFVLPERFDNYEDYEGLVARLKPDVYAVSSNYPYMETAREILETYGGKVEVVLDWNPEVSTSLLIQNSKLRVQSWRQEGARSKKLGAGRNTKFQSKQNTGYGRHKKAIGIGQIPDSNHSNLRADFRSCFRDDMLEDVSWFRARVVRGHGRGKLLGFPTLNLEVPSFAADYVETSTAKKATEAKPNGFEFEEGIYAGLVRIEKSGVRSQESEGIDNQKHESNILNKSFGVAKEIPDSNPPATSGLTRHASGMTDRAMKDKDLFLGGFHYGKVPTFGQEEMSLEVFVLDVDLMETPEEVEFCLVKKLREVIKFDGPDALTAQIEEDVEEIRELLGEDIR